MKKLYVLIPMGLEAPERARILVHSAWTNLKHYTFSREKEFLYEVADIWDKYNENNAEDGAHEVRWTSVLRGPK